MRKNYSIIKFFKLNTSNTALKFIFHAISCKFFFIDINAIFLILFQNTCIKPFFKCCLCVRIRIFTSWKFKSDDVVFVLIEVCLTLFLTDDLMACGSMAAAKEKGLVRSEGKDYVMKDGDIVLFRFNV